MAEASKADPAKAEVEADLAELGAWASRLEGRFQATKQQLSAERAEVEQQRAALEREKAAMQAEGVSDEDIITLNVSGTVMAARRSTLCKVRGSLLEAMFSGRWEGTLAQDPEGRVFLEFNPKCFRALLNALIFDTMHPEGTAVQDLFMDKDLRKRARDCRDLSHMLEYLGLRPMTTPVQLRASSTGGLTISKNGKTATRDATVLGCVCLVGQDVLPASTARLEGLAASWETELLFFPSNSGSSAFMAGVLSGSRTQQPQLNDASYGDPGCYGWYGHPSAGGCYTYTAGSATSGSWGSFKKGDRVALSLDAAPAAGAPGALVMTITRSGAAITTQTLQLPSLAADQGWYIQFCMWGPCSFQVSDLTYE